jgi:Tol biopolymer transport system component
MWVRLAIAVGVAVALGGGAAEADTSGVNEFAFLSERGGVSSVVLAHGGKTTTLARNADGPPTWFRDGRRLAYAAAGKVHVVTIGGRRRAIAGCRGKIAVAPSGRAVICEGSGDADAFHHVDLVSGRVTLLGSNDDGLGDTTPQDPAWAADGTIALIPSTDSPIYLYRLQGSGIDLRLSRPLREIAYPNGAETPHDPAFSPDGRWLAFTVCGACRPSEAGDRSRAQIWIADVRSGKLVRRLTKRGWQPSWSPTGNELAFVSDMHGDVEIYTVSRDGSNLRRITFRPAADTEPAWRPRPR